MQPGVLSCTKLLGPAFADEWHFAEEIFPRHILNTSLTHPQAFSTECSPAADEIEVKRGGRSTPASIFQVSKLSSANHSSRCSLDETPLQGHCRAIAGRLHMIAAHPYVSSKISDKEMCGNTFFGYFPSPGSCRGSSKTV